MGEMAVMGTSLTLREILKDTYGGEITGGDTRIIWDSSKRDEVDNARRAFDDLTRKKYRAFSVDRSGEKSELVTTFDAAAEKYLFIPPMAGGR
jgi:hypothetical protein